MTVMITPEQVPQVWEAIKYAAVNADQVEESYRLSYLNRLLYQLLSGKAQCFVRLNNERKLQAICITKIVVDDMTDDKSLLIDIVYSFDKVDVNQWIDDFGMLKKFAKKSGCRTLTGWTANDKITQLSKAFGMRERFRSYILEV